MNLLDLAVLASLVATGLAGFRMGFVARVTSWIGMAVGFVVAAALLPGLLGRMHDASADSRLLLALGLLLGGSFLGQAAGLVAGSKLHLALPHGRARGVDRTAGSLAGGMSVLIAVWIMLPTMADVPGWPAEQARTSKIAELVESLFPPPPDTLRTLRALVGEDNFPQVFSALQAAPDVGPPPGESGLSPEVIARVRASAVKLEGIACRRVQEGSGFVVADGLVVTNAHVVAGVDDQAVVRPDGSRVQGEVVVFDSDRDLALVRAPNLRLAPLPVGDISQGGTGAVFGYPGGGELRVSPFQVAQEIEAVGRDLYDRHKTRRDVLVLASDLHPGDSGSGLFDQAGEAVGVAFAIAPDQPGTAYALTVDELAAVLSMDRSRPVDTGKCLR